MTKKTIYYLLLIAVIILGLGSFIFYSNKEETMGASLTLAAEKSQYTVGEQVTIDIFLDAKELVDGVDLVINYEPQYLKVENETTFFDARDSIFAGFPRPEIDTAAGLIRLSAITRPGKNFKGTGKIASLFFEAQEKGETQVNFLFEQGSTVDSNVSSFTEAKDILSKATNVSLKIY